MFVIMRNQSITKTNMYSSQKMSLLSNLKYVTLHSKISGIAGFKKSTSVFVIILLFYFIQIYKINCNFIEIGHLYFLNPIEHLYCYSFINSLCFPLEWFF